MKILFITSSSINGGAQKHIREMFISLTKMGHKVTLAAPTGWLIDELKNYKDNLIPFSSTKDGYQKIVRWIEDEKPDITNTFILSGGVLGTCAWRKKMYGKLFVTVNNPVIYDGIKWYQKLVYPSLYRWMSKYASAFLVKSDTVRDEVASVVNKRKPVLSIKNGVDFTVFDKNAEYADLREKLGIKKDEIVITNVAVLNERKGQQNLIEAVASLRKKYPVHLILAGEGPYRAELENKVKQNCIGDVVHFLGRRSDVNCVLANSNIFVLSSYHEGLPNSLMEAMAMGLPCVSTDVGGVRQLIIDGENGKIVPAKSSKGIIKAVTEYLKDPAIMKSYGENAYAFLRQNFEQHAVAEELFDIYREY